MKNKVIWLGLSFLIVAMMVLSSCATSGTSTSTETVTSTAVSTVTTSTSVSTTTTNTGTATVTNATTTATTTATGNWWDSLGTPQYGGQMSLRVNKDVAIFDPYLGGSNTSLMQGWLEKLTSDTWTVNPAVFAYITPYRPSQFVGGTLAQSWEFTDPSTLVYHLRQGLNWQNLPPANGREFVAEDVVYSYDRLTGLGDGFTTPAVIYAASAIVKSLQSVTATGKYTVTFKWKTPSQESMVEILQSPSNQNLIVCPEAVQQYGNLNDWHHAVGTGPFICQDFVSGNSLTMVRNPNYWGYDERYPQDHLPYVNEIQYLVIPDIATAMAAMRVGKIDAMDGLTVDQAKQIAQTNPEISEIATPGVAAQTICPRVDLAPFSDIRVREALQQAINLPLIAQTYYSGTCLPYPSTLTSNYVTGMGFPYVQWPQALQDEYAYNPTNAKALLAAAGYPNGFNTTCVADSSGDLTLLQIVQSEWASVGINLSIQTMDPAAWTAYTTALQFTGLCMKAGGFLGVAYEPITQITNLSTNNLYWYGVTDPTGPALYQQALAASTVDQVYQILIQANKYVAQSHNLISLLQPTTYTLRQPWLKGYTAQNRSILTASLYPAFLNFYGARFWIAK